MGELTASSSEKSSMVKTLSRREQRLADLKAVKVRAYEEVLQRNAARKLRRVEGEIGVESDEEVVNPNEKAHANERMTEGIALMKQSVEFGRALTANLAELSKTVAATADSQQHVRKSNASLDLSRNWVATKKAKYELLQDENSKAEYLNALEAQEAETKKVGLANLNFFGI